MAYYGYGQEVLAERETKSKSPSFLIFATLNRSMHSASHGIQADDKQFVTFGWSV